MIFRALWPILDDTPSATGYAQLLDEARADLPAILARHSARATGPGSFSIAASKDVPGSGRVTESVLIWEGPVVAAEPRVYRTRTQAVAS